MGQVITALPADREAAELKQPRDGALGDPAETPQARAGLDALAGDPVQDPALLEVGVGAGNVIGLVRVQLLRPDAGAATRPRDRLDQFDERFKQLAVVVVGCSLPVAQGDATAVDQEVVFGAGLAAIGRIRPGFGPPFFARRLPESRLARLQSIRSAAPRRSSSTVCRRCQTLA